MSFEFTAKNGLISRGNTQITGTLTVSQGITSSLGAFTTASWAFNTVTASFISSVSTASFSTSASYAVSSSQAASASFASTASYAVTSSFATTSSFAVTSSVLIGIPSLKGGIVSGSAFSGSPRTASVAFTKPYPNTNYSVVVTGDNARTWTIQTKVSGSFVINSNSSVVVSGSVYWQTMNVGEFF